MKQVTNNMSFQKRCILGKKPKNDDAYFEQVVKAVFRSGFSWPVIEKKWPSFSKAFANFSVAKVAKFTTRDLDRLIKDEGIVRNRRKILAAVENAKIVLEIRKEYGSVATYIQTLKKDGEVAMSKAIAKRFSGIGESMVVSLLRSFGEEVPVLMKLWAQKHNERIGGASP